ncbi:zinc finger lsd1 subclass family protein, putative, partial [Ichthyophthirius multifiliis]
VHRCGFIVSGTNGAIHVTRCNTYKLLGGYDVCGKNCVLQNTFRSNLPVYQYKIEFQYIMIDQWDDKVENITINGVIAQTLQKDTTASTSLCGGPTNEKIQKVEIYYQTSERIINVTFSNNLNLDASIQSFGINELIVTGFQCMSQCAQCTDHTSCDLCNPGFFYNDSQCINSCPGRKFENAVSRTCDDCNNRCASCSDAINCDSCFENRVSQQCICPQYSYDPNAFDQACIICSTFSTGCATCSATECLTCIAPQYFQLNQNKQCDSCLNIT